MLSRILVLGGFACVISAWAADDTLALRSRGTQALLTVEGSSAEWRFQVSQDLLVWSNAPALGTVFGNGGTSELPGVDTAAQERAFVRAAKVEGLFDPNLLRTVNLTFTNANWATLLANARTTDGNVPAYLALDNGRVIPNAGARYKGNTSYTMSGAKKSINLDINYADPDARLMGYRAVNLNNAAGDETVMREPLYFETMRTYAPSPHGALARLTINGEYWGLYSMVDQLNNDLADEWFPSHEGDRWRAPNAGGGGRPGGGGGGGFSSAASAFSYLGALVSSYTNNYQLKSDNSTNAWERLVHAIDVLNNTSTNELRDKVEGVFAVDRWLWFLAVENIFVDDDSYWNKGADYAFYYEPESGRIHPVEHDGNEAFTSASGINYTLSPVQGATASNRPLLFRLLRINELRQRYLAHMRTVLAEKFHPEILTPQINFLHHLSSAAIIADTRKNYTLTSYTNDLNALKTYVTNRYRFLTNHAELRSQPPQIAAVIGPQVPPGPTEAALITALVHPADTNGIDCVWLYFRDKVYGRFSVSQMFDDGGHGDGEAGDGVFGASTTNYPAGKKIHYYVEARSANSARAAAFAPARAEQETYSYRVGLTNATETSVVINEIMADNQTAVADPQGEFDDWIELRNLADAPVDLTGHYLTDNPEAPRKWQFPEGTRIPAGGYLLIWADENGSDTPGLHASFRLSKSGEQVLLTAPDSEFNAVLDSVSFGPQETDRSYGRSPEEAGTFVLMSPSPGEAN
jgi:spore coat protein CotH